MINKDTQKRLISNEEESEEMINIKDPEIGVQNRRQGLKGTFR